MKTILFLVAILPLAVFGNKICLNEGTGNEGTGNVCYLGGDKRTGMDKEFTAWQNIRYAKPPTGDLRFKDPEMFEPQDGDFDVSEDAIIECPQISFVGDRGPIGTEDCLSLNIYKPKNSESAKLPVMVYIFGGNFFFGSNRIDEYGPDYFMDQENVILVTINYRLGPLGFMTIKSEGITGNQGLKDQTLALKWIKENINSFGGDPDTVTIFGASSGAMSASCLLISPKTKGLFSRAILQSGTAIDPAWRPIHEDQAEEYSQKLAEHWECPSDITRLQCFQNKDQENFVEATWFMQGNLWMPSYSSKESSSNSDNFLVEKPLDTLDSANFNDDGHITDVIIGTTKDEGLMYFLDDNLKDFNLAEDYPTSAARLLFDLPYTSDVTSTQKEAAERVIEYYIDTIDNYNVEHLPKIVEMMTDARSLFGSFKTALKLTTRGINVYQYILNHEGKNSWSKIDHGIEPKGVIHGDELFYLFKWQRFDVTLNADDKKVRDVMVREWTNFAESGNPNGEGKQQPWKEVKEDNVYQDIMRHWGINTGETQQMKVNKKMNKRMAFWKNLMRNYSYDLE